jgi:hypothetical protein
VRNIILFHGDLDGLYSGLLFFLQNENQLTIDEIRSVDYGQDHSTLKDQFDNFFVFDFAENPGGEKTVLWVDHHLRQGENGASCHVIGESPSCVRLLIDRNVVSKNLLAEEDVKCIDIVDSASYNWSNEFKHENLIFPSLTKGKLDRYIALNQLLRKNRKNGLAEKLFVTTSLKVDVLLYSIEKDTNYKTLKYKAFMDNKQKLLNKLSKGIDKYIKYFDEIPVLFTKEFTQEDWKGYDFNVFGYLVNKSPYLIVIYDFDNGINIQVARNAFCNTKSDSVYSIIKEEVSDPRGHEGIMNVSFTNQNEAITKLDSIIKKLALHL